MVAVCLLSCPTLKEHTQKEQERLSAKQSPALTLSGPRKPGTPLVGGPRAQVCGRQHPPRAERA